MRNEVEVFEGARARLEAIAYRLLGSANDAEDAVQDTFLRWQSADRELSAAPPPTAAFPASPSTPTTSPASSPRCGCVRVWPTSPRAEPCSSSAVASPASRPPPDLEVSLAARGGLGDWLSEKAQSHLRKAFDRLGITVHEHTDIAGVEPTGAVTADGRAIPAQVTVWTAGFAVHPLAAATTLQVSATGQVVVDDAMRSVSHPDV